MHVAKASPLYHGSAINHSVKYRGGKFGRISAIFQVTIAKKTHALVLLRPYKTGGKCPRSGFIRVKPKEKLTIISVEDLTNLVCVQLNQVNEDAVNM